MARPTTAAAPPIQRPRSRHTPRSRKPPRIILSVCISEILPPNIQKSRRWRCDALQQPYGGARDEITHSYSGSVNFGPLFFHCRGRLLFDALPTCEVCANAGALIMPTVKTPMTSDICASVAIPLLERIIIFLFLCVLELPRR